MASPYKSIEDRIILPHKTKLKDHQRIFKPLDTVKAAQTYELSEALYAKTNSLVDELNDTFEIFQNPNHFRFKFPQSMFPPVEPGQRNNIRYEQKMISEQENTFKDRLSQEQLKDIEETGQFKVKSNIQYITLPYVWKINQTLFWGKKRVTQVWNRSIATIFGFFWLAKRNLEVQIPQQLSNLASYPKRLADLLVGLKSIKTVIPVYYQRQVFKDFWSKIVTEYYKQSDEWCSALWNYLYVYYNPELSRPLPQSQTPAEAQKRQKQRYQLQNQFQAAKQASQQKKNEILEIHNNFNQQWGKLKKKVIIQITAEMNETNKQTQKNTTKQQQPLIAGEESKNDKLILQKLAQKKFTLYVQHLKAELPKKAVSLDIINAIVLMLRLFNLLNAKTEKKNQQKSKIKQQIKQKVRKLHTIKSLFTPFFDALVNSEMEPISKALDQEFYEQILKDKAIVGLLSNSQVQAIKEFIKFRTNHDALIQAKKKAKPQYHGPSRVFYSNYPLIPPYKVLKESNTYYSLKKVSDDMMVDTSTNFWKLKLYFMRFKTWTMNFLVFLAFSAWKGPLGLRCLWGIDDFRTEMNINYQSGEIYYQMRPTVIGTFNNVLKGIEKSRELFEQTPDLGLLGKNLSRYFNYFECYVFRFFFVGVVLTLIGYPILIVVASSLVVVLVLSFWAWIPLIMAVCYIFNIFIKQFQTSYIQYGFWSRSFPIIRLTLGILKCFGIILFSILNLVLIAPIKGFFLLLFCSIQRLFRKTVDSTMVFLFSKVGRTPSRDTNIARKISGPGMTKDFYMSINEEDVYVLVQSRLEQIYLYEFDRLIRSKIQENGNRFRATVTKVLSPFSVTYSSFNLLLENINILSTTYSHQYNLHCNRYPSNPYNVRFTQQQIDSYFDNTVTIVRRFVDKHQIHWIFDRYQLYEGMYDELTRNIWTDIFGCGEEILEPLQKMDSRFRLEDQYQQADGVNYQMKKRVGSVMKALEGQVYLEHNIRKVAPFKHSLFNREMDTQQISTIFAYHNLNSLSNVHTDRNDISMLFIPNLNIKEIITVDDEARVRNIQEEKNIIDL